jgi:dihydroneopterin aldolase/D-erythro-7,8-dihydroneopterin triphosphate epimerase
MDRIYIRDLALRCIIGVYARERKMLQDVVINMTLEGNFSGAGRSDRIAQAVNYKTVTKQVIKLVEKSRYFLVETLAVRIAAVCMKAPRVEPVTVTVDKPGALRFARSVAVEITRERKRTRS